MKGKIIRASVLATLLPATVPVGAEEWKNWFNDPFFQVRNGMADCPAPLGPLLPQSRRNEEAHSRVERGTSCWMAGKCSRANAYWYDADIGKAVEKTFTDTQDFRDASLWITVQRRFIMVEGCVAATEQVQRIEALLQALRDVERVIVQVRRPGDAKPPYALLPDEAGIGK